MPYDCSPFYQETCDSSGLGRCAPTLASRERLIANITLVSYTDDNDVGRPSLWGAWLMPSPVSVRLPEAIEGKVRQIAAIEHRSFADTVKLLTLEAIKQREFPEIVFADGPTGRRASLRNGPDVWEVVEPYVVGGKDWAVVRESFPHLDEALLQIALRYYENYPEEIDARIAANQDA